MSIAEATISFTRGAFLIGAVIAFVGATIFTFLMSDAEYDKEEDTDEVPPLKVQKR